VSQITGKPFVVEGGYVELRCPHDQCECPETHVMDVRWETDPHEGDRKHVRMEVRCEEGHGYVLSLTNHAGRSSFRWEPLTDIRSPFDDDVKVW
jgi:hypothetical protein